MSKALITYLKIYDKYISNGFQKAGPIAKDHAYRFIKLLTKTEDPTYDFIKSIPDNFKASAIEKFNIKNEDVGTFNVDNSIYNVALTGCVLDGKFFQFDNTEIKYGLGFTEPENTVTGIDGDIDNAQIIVDEPAFIMITENKAIQDVKLINSPYTALKVNPISLTKTTTERYAELVADLKSQYTDGVYVKENVIEHEIFYIDTKVVGEYDKKDTYSNPDDLYKLLKIEKIRSIYVKPENKIFVVYDTVTGEELFKIKEDGTLYEGADIEVTTEVYRDIHKAETPESKTSPLMTKYTIKASISGQPLTLSEIKADPNIISQIEEKLKELFGADMPVETSGVSTQMHKILGTNVLEQPFAGLNKACLDITENSYDINEVVKYLETFTGITHIYHYGQCFKLNSFTKVKTADYNYLKSVDNTRDSNTELVIYKGECPDNKAFFFLDINKNNINGDIIGVTDITNIKIIFRNNAEFILDVTPLPEDRNKSIHDIINAGSTGVLEIKSNNEREIDASNLSYIDRDLGDFTTGISIHRPITVTTDGIKYNASTLVVDTRANGIHQDVNFEIIPIEIDAEEPVTEIRLEDIEVIIEKII